MKADPLMSVADQCRALGIKVGDTIEGTERGEGYWHIARLTLLWLGDRVAVWSIVERSSTLPKWSEPREDGARWTLAYREWEFVKEGDK